LSGSVVLQLLAVLLPWPRQLFGLTRLSLLDGVVVALEAVDSLLLNEGTKR